MDVDAAVEGDEFAAENGFDHIVARDDVPGSLEEKGEQIEFNGGELDFAIFAADGAGAFVQFDIAENDCFRDGRGRIGRGKNAAPEHRLNAGSQLARIKGLHQVVVGADFQAVDAIHVVAAGGEHNYREAGFLPDLAESFEAFDLGKHDVEDDQGKLAGDGAGQAFCAVIGNVNAEALGLEVLAEEFAELNVIVDNQNAGRRSVRDFAFVYEHGMRAAVGREPGRARRE